MKRRRVSIVGCVLVAVLAFPREGSARLLDLIWEMSGPQMVGLVAYCTFDFRGNPIECRIPFRSLLDRRALSAPRAWFSLEGGGYVSTGKDGIIPFDFGDVWMAVLDPMIEFRVSQARLFNRVRIAHGVGATFNYFVGSGFDGFAKAGLKFRPVSAEFGRNWELAYTIRVYPDPVEPEDFDVNPGLRNNELEATHGLTLLYRF